MNEEFNTIKMHGINNVFVHIVYFFNHLNWIVLLLYFQYLEQEKKTREGSDLQKVRTYAR